MNYELRQYSFGETIGKAFNLYFNNFMILVLISLLCQMPVVFMFQFAGLLNLSQGLQPDWPAFLIKMALFGLTGLVVWAFLTAIVINLVAKKFLEASSGSIAHQTASGLSLILPVAGLSILVGLFTWLWTMLFVIPGIIAWLSYSVASAVLVIERQTIRQSIRRSKFLTKGKRWGIFGLLIVMGIIISLINQSLVLLLHFCNLSPGVLVYLDHAVSALTGPIQACLMVVIYFNLRIEKEGFNIEHLARQFSLAQAGPSGPSLEI
ncbi:MAG: hypothetical protein PVH64_09755 [Bacillota bacterium]|jgi:hypothetical protein